MTEVDLVVIGAGPAGMSAAKTAAHHGLSVVLLGEQAHAGGQIYRNVGQTHPKLGPVLGADYLIGVGLVNDLEGSGITHVKGAVVWRADPDGTIAYSVKGQGTVVRPNRVLLATGALERAMPVPGWTLPGVMTAGAAQILLKTSAIAPTEAVLIGTGPLLYLLAVQMVRAGTPPIALIETQTPSDFGSALSQLPQATLNWPLLAKGVNLLAELRRSGVPRYKGARDIQILGTDRVQAVEFSQKGKSHQINCQNALLHHGVIPNTQISRSLNLDHYWNAEQHAFSPVVNDWGQSSNEVFYIAGDGAGIAGAKAAEFGGRIAALQIAHDLGRLSAIDRDHAAKLLQKERRRELSCRSFLDRAYPPYAAALAPPDTTIVCRCSEVTAGDIRGYARLGCLGPNQTKAFGRAGMGPCQGRYCGPLVTDILAQFHGTSQDEIGAYRIRPPLKPVTLAEIAALAEDP